MFYLLFFSKVASFCAHLGFFHVLKTEKEAESGGEGVLTAGHLEPLYLNHHSSPTESSG